MPSSVIANLIGNSPFKPLQEHMRAVNDCISEVPSLFEALVNGDQSKVITIKDSIFAKEAIADTIKNELRANLPKSLFMPVDRRDLLDILQTQDTIADVAQDIAGLLVERPMDVPNQLKKPIVELVNRCVDVCDHAAKIIEELDELIAIGFGGNEANKVDQMLSELNSIEDETDEMGQNLTSLLFKHEDEINPVSVMMWYRIIEWIGDLADYAEKTGDRLRLLIAR
jgi:predicted phosphate transport protein (TIGR00153 family)